MDRGKLLIVDDTPENLRVLYQALKDGYDVFSATSGGEALKLAASIQPDLVLLDIMMPEMDGYEVCAGLKRSAATRHIPVIFITAKTDFESETRALSVGGVDFIHKPFNRDVVRVRVALHIELERRARALHLANEELRRHRDHLEELVYARTRELAEARDEAESANRAKSAFLANMGHELRTPMNQVMGLVFLLGREIRDERQRERLGKIEQASRRLLGLLSDILDFGGIEAGRLAIGTMDFELIPLLERVASGIHENAALKGLELVREIDPALPSMLKGDPLRLNQILATLLDNAVKFSERGCITLRVRRVDADRRMVNVRFEVEDQGIGMPPEVQAGLFQLFNQGDNSSTRRYGGTGLGLALCKRLVSLMAGTMGVNSAPGRGSVFWFLLPFPLAVEPLDDEEQTEVAEVDRNRVAEIFTCLEKLLEESDLHARTLWAESRGLLEPAFQGGLAAVDRAMESYDFDAALQLLRQAVHERVLKK